jgi:hypothetical protein
MKPGAVLSVTVTLRIVCAALLPSDADNMKLALVAPQAAMISAVTDPLVLTRLETVTPLTVDEAPPSTVTLTLPSPMSKLLTAAMVELAEGDPACLVTPDSARTVGMVGDAPAPVNI